MKKSNIILALFFAWLSVFSLVVTPGLAIEWPHIDHETYEISGNYVKKINLYVLYDHEITFEYNTTENLNISMLLILKTADDDYDGSFTDITEGNLTIMNPILNIPATDNLTTTDKWYVPTKEIYRMVFINLNSQDAEFTLTIMKEEIGKSSYIFGGVVSVLFVCSLFFILRKRSKLLQPDEPEESSNNIHSE